MSKPYQVGDILDVLVEKIIPNGLGLCFAENLTVFVPLSVTGDRLRVEIRQLKGKTCFAGILEILDPSPQRAEPKCVYFGVCGGCDFQQMTYDAQLESKIGIIRDCLGRIGRIDFEPEIRIIRSPEEYGYRLRTQWHADTRKGTIGYFKRQSHDVVDAKACPILTSELENKLCSLREDIPWSTYVSDSINIEAASGADGQVSIYAEELLESKNELSIDVGEDKLFFDAQTFFQGNRFLINELVASAIGNAKGKTAVDLFCGAGLFTVPLARLFEEVLAVESSEASIKFAKKNVEYAGLENVSLFHGRIKQFLNEGIAENSEIDFILVDPPRSGVKKGALEMIADLKAKRISYVSCNPSTLARDLRILIDREYSIESITAIDLFPQTHHIETVVQLACN